MTLKLEENELLAALATGRWMKDVPLADATADFWKRIYLLKLREFIELNKADDNAGVT